MARCACRFRGRCLLSNYMAGRDANRGACAQPCRWKYALVEEKRPGQYMPIYQEGEGSYILNSKRHVHGAPSAGAAPGGGYQPKDRGTCKVVVLRGR